MSTPNSKDISSSDVRYLLMAYSGHGRESSYKQVGRTAWTPTAYHLGRDTTRNYVFWVRVDTSPLPPPFDEMMCPVSP